ncbi:MAG: LacI family DNA-binding transcriptional regulator [Pseudomonadota bacterium]
MSVAPEKTARPVRPVRVRLTDLADALGLTKGTVSRALNGYPDIAEATQLRVRRKAEAMGYRPLAQAQAIRTGRTCTLGLVLQTDTDGSQRPFLSDFLEGVTRAASAENWTTTVATAEPGEEMEMVLGRLVEERKADGFILPRTHTVDRRAILLRDLGVPFVLFGRVADAAGCAWFDILGEAAMRDAAMRLATQGHRRIGFVNGAFTYSFAGLRDQGFRDGMARAGLTLDESLIRSGAMSREAGAEAAAALLHRPEPPTAIIFAVDRAALGGYDAAEAAGLRVGQDLSIIGYDGIPEGRWMRPTLTTFSVDSRGAGARLATLLIRRIRGEAAETLRETAEARLQTGGSDGPPQRTSADIAAHIAAQTEHEEC